VSAFQVVALVLGILVFIAVLFAVVMVPIARRARGQRAALQQELGEGVRRTANARGLGLESRGAGQVRGNGWLVLTPDELRFRQWVPQRDTRIPLDAVTTVETKRAWLGKTVGSRLLCVRWRMPDGTEEAMAWEVPDLDEWLAELADGPETVS
jgi:hypothetical protein